MKLVGVIGTAALCLTLGAAPAAYAQQEQHDQQEEQKDKPAQQDEKKAQPTQAPKPEEKNARQEDKNLKPEERKTEQQDKNAKPEEKNAQQQQERTQQAKPEQHEQHAGNNGGGRIPEDRYKANFGQEHRFHVSQADYSNRRFQYGGYWFGFEGAWPSNWLYTQDVYVVEIDGVYYLCNANYPGVNIVLSVTL